MMDLVHDRAVIMAEEDRISNLSDDIINRILSFVEMKDAIQTSKLSRRWRHLWTSVPHINLDTSEFRSLLIFAKFVKHALSHRNKKAPLSSVNLTFTGAATSFAVRSIIKYAFSHNVKQLTMGWYAQKSLEFPQCLFSSHTLKILTLNVSIMERCTVPGSGWDLPSLETLNMTNINFAVGTDMTLNPFSKCVNLKNLTLDRFRMYNVGIFIIYAPQLSDLTITNAFGFPNAFNVVAPQLQNLTASLNERNSYYHLRTKLQLLTAGFNSLVKVELSVCSSSSSYRDREKYVPLLLDLFHKFCSATTLVLDQHIIEAISSSLDEFSHEPCPFNNLKCLKVHGVSCYPTQAKNYLLESSPSATFVMDLPQVPQKSSREPVPDDGMANKVAKLVTENKQAETTDNEKRTLKAKLPTQDDIIAELRAKVQMLETRKWQYEELMPHIIKGKMAELKLQVESGNPDDELIRSMGREIKSLIYLIPKCSRVAVEAHFSTQYEEVKCWSRTYIDARQWAKIETQLGFLTDFERVYSNNIQIQSDILITDTAPTPSSANALSSCLDEFSHEPCQVKNNLLKNSPSATYNMDSPQVPQMRSREPVHNDGMANKVAKLEAENKQAETTDKENRTSKAKIPNQGEVIAELRAKIQNPETTESQYEKLMPHIIKGKVAELNLQVESGKPDYEVIRSMGCEIKSLMDLMPNCSRVGMRAHFSTWYKDMKQRSRTYIQIWSDILTTDSAPTPSSSDTTKRRYEKLMPRIIHGKISELKLYVNCGNPDYEVILSMGCEIKSLIDLIPKCSRVAMEANFSILYKEVKRLSSTYFNTWQWAKIETQLGYLMHAKRVYSNNIQIQADILNIDTAPTPSSVNAFSPCLDEFSHEPCRVKNNLLENSSCATFNMNSPQKVPQKRSRESAPNDGMANKVAKLEAENKQEETMGEEKRTSKAKLPTQGDVISELRAKIKDLERTDFQYYLLMEHIIKWKMADLKPQVVSGNPDYEVIRSMGCEIKSFIDSIPKCPLRISMESFFSTRYREVKTQTRTYINPRQWAKIESELGYLTEFERAQYNNIQIRTDILSTIFS